MKNPIITAVLLCSLFGAPLAGFADNDYSKFGVTNSDMAAYKRLSIPSCAAAREQNKDPWHPLANVDYLRHVAHLYGQCHNALEHQGAAIGILRANDIYFGMTCVALGTVDTADEVDPVCNIKSAIPGP